MRSRYSAYAFCLPLYIIKTTHPSNHDYNENKEIWIQDIIEFSKNFSFEKLTIIEFIEDTYKSFVTFKAAITKNNEDHSFTEKSVFSKIDGNWYYLEAFIEK